MIEKLRNYSIKNQVIIICLLSSLTAFTFSALIFLFFDVKQTFHNLAQEVESLAQMVGNNSTAALTFKDKETASEILSSLRYDLEVEEAILFDETDLKFAHYLKKGAKHQSLPDTEKGLTFTTSFLHYNKSILLDDAPVGRLYLRVGFQDIHKQLKIVFIASTASIILAFLFVWAMVSRLQTVISKPMLELAGAMKQISSDKNYSMRLPEEFSDEVGQLTKGFNDMLQEIETRDQSLLLSERKYRSFVENTDNLVTQVDATGVFSFVNKEAEHIFGVKPAELIGTSAFQFIHPEDQDRTQKWFNNCVAQKAILASIENRQVNKATGEITYILWSTSFIYDENAEIVSINAFGHNITDKKRLENEQLKTKKLEATAVLAGGIAHDFNNLLAVIAGNIDLVLEDTPPESSSHKFLENAYKASLKGKELTSKFLTFAQGGSPVKTITSLNKLITTSVEIALFGTNIDYSLSIPLDLWPVNIDQSQISQVFYNIILNAKEAMPDGGKLKVQATNLKESERSGETAFSELSGDYVKITFTDKGHGINKEVLPKIFDPYFSTKEMGAQKGMGLGLTIVNSIIYKHQGIVTINSTARNGTTVSILLPAATDQLDSKATD